MKVVFLSPQLSDEDRKEAQKLVGMQKEKVKFVEIETRQNINLKIMTLNEISRNQDFSVLSVTLLCLKQMKLLDIDPFNANFNQLGLINLNLLSKKIGINSKKKYDYLPNLITKMGGIIKNYKDDDVDFIITDRQCSKKELSKPLYSHLLIEFLSQNQLPKVNENNYSRYAVPQTRLQTPVKMVKSLNCPNPGEHLKKLENNHDIHEYVCVSQKPAQRNADVNNGQAFEMSKSQNCNQPRLKKNNKERFNDVSSMVDFVKLTVKEEPQDTPGSDVSDIPDEQDDLIIRTPEMKPKQPVNITPPSVENDNKEENLDFNTGINYEKNFSPKLNSAINTIMDLIQKKPRQTITLDKIPIDELNQFSQIAPNDADDNQEFDIDYESAKELTSSQQIKPSEIDPLIAMCGTFQLNSQSSQNSQTSQSSQINFA